jgi:predicted N-acetyltransferase YhbS
MIQIANETAADIVAREALLDRAMGPERVLKPSERLRGGRLPAHGLALVARDDDDVVGTVRLWNVSAGGRPALLLGPLAVSPDARGKGVGVDLMHAALGRAEAIGHCAVILVGDPEYYARFGFTADRTTGLYMPGPVERRRFLGLEFRSSALRGAEGRVVASGAPSARANASELARAA